MLIESIRAALFGGPAAPADGTEPSAPAPSPAAPDGPDPLHVAACALLLEIAHADGEFSDAEQAHLEEVLARHFSLPLEAGRDLLVIAEKERHQAIDHFRFTTQLREGYDVGQKMVLAEIMWGLVLADGEIASHEHYLTRKISNLLDLEPGYLSAAKANAARGTG